ncbi:hypothetical protein MRX96_043657 [Rhipicephalus microplus]
MAAPSEAGCMAVPLICRAAVGAAVVLLPLRAVVYALKLIGRTKPARSLRLLAEDSFSSLQRVSPSLVGALGSSRSDSGRGRELGIDRCDWARGDCSTLFRSDQCILPYEDLTHQA